MNTFKSTFSNYSKLLLSVLILSMSACGGSNTSKENAEDVWVAPENTDTIATLPPVEVIDDTVTIHEKLYHFSYTLSHVDSLPIITSYTGQRYYDNAVDLTVRNDSSTLFKKHFTKNNFKDIVPSKDLKKMSLVGFNYYQAKRDDHTNFHFVAMIGDPDDNDESLYFVDIQLNRSGDMHLQKAKTEDFFTMPLDYEEEENDNE